MSPNDLITDPSIEFWLTWFITIFVMLFMGYRAGRHGTCPHHIFWGSKGCIWTSKTIVITDFEVTMTINKHKEQDSE